MHFPGAWIGITCAGLRESAALIAGSAHEADPESLAYAKSLLPEDCEWAAFGASRMAFPMVAQAFPMGGHCPIGMEDSVYLAKGVKAPDNAALVAKAARIIDDLGGRVATVDETRALLGIA